MDDSIMSMETSTPLPGPSTGRKRKGLGNHLDPSESARKRASLMEEDLENHEMERSKRRSMAQVAHSIRSTANALTKETIIPQLDACMTLYSSNKIDTNNVWAFMIIDILSEIAKNNTFDKETLKVAASSLDAGSKVYGVRVDCVHNHTIHLAANMIREFSKKKNVEEEENPPENDLDEPQAKRQKKAKAKRILLSPESFPHSVDDVNTLLAPIKQIPSNDLQLNYSGFYNQSLPFDHMLRYKLPEDRFFQMEEDWADMDMAIYDEYIEVPLDFYEELYSNLCPAFTDFNCGSNGDEETVDQEEERNEVLFDDEGFPIPELDGSIHDPFQDPNYLEDDKDAEEEVHEFAQPDMEFRRVAQVGAHVDDIGYEYLYQTLQSETTHRFVNLWAGPSHWKLKCIKQAKSTFTGTINKEETKNKRRVKKKEAIEMVFTEDIELTTDCGFKKKKTKKYPKFATYQLPKREVDENYKPMETFRNRYIIPAGASLDNICKNTANPDVPAEVENLPTDYNYDNPNDSQYCVNSDDVEAYNDDLNAEGNATNEMLEGEEGQRRGDVEGEMEWPETVAKCDIGYAHTAKKMDMKKLKCAVWDSLVGTNTYTSGDIEKSTKKVPRAIHFKDIYENLPRKINAQMREALSVPLAFMALLHLANEKTLMLESTSNHEDIIITQK